MGGFRGELALGDWNATQRDAPPHYDPRVNREPVRILVPLERGESAREPARLLGALFAPAAIRARAIHVGRVAVPLSYPFGPEALGTLRREQLAWEEEARRALKRQVGPLEDAGFAVEVEVTAGSALGEVLKRERLWRADLVLARPIGHTRSRGLGSVAAGLIQAASAPVLLYRKVPANFRVRRVLAPIDFSPFSRRAVGWALLVASLARADLRLLHVLPEVSARWGPGLRHMAVEMVREERQRAQRQLRHFGSPAISVEGIVVEREHPGRGVLQALKDGIDLIVLGASGKSGITAVLGSVTRQVVRESPYPALVIPTSNRVSAQEVWKRSRR
jgi:nucleotide-binding universal stress UspA family protein